MKNTVTIFFKRLFELDKDIRDMAGIKVAAVGPKTENAIKNHGIKSDILAEEYTAEGLIEELTKVLSSEDKVLIPRAKIARKELVEELSKISKVEEVHIYDTLKTKESIDGIIESLKDLDSYYLLFTSSSTFTNFVEILGEKRNQVLDKGKIISIGPITTKTIEESGNKVYKEAKEYTIDGIIKLFIEEKI